MKEIHEFRILKEDYHLLPPNNAKFNGALYVLHVSKGDPLFQEIGRINQAYRKAHGVSFFGHSQVRRTYTPREWAAAKLCHFRIKYAFEPVGEQYGTVYDEAVACQICGAGRKQIGPLKLKKGSIPKKDTARTIAGEMVVSERFAEVVRQRGLKGIQLEPVLFPKRAAPYYQLAACSPPLELSGQTAVGISPFDLSNETQEAEEFTVSGGHKIKFERVVLKCPTGHLVGAGLISEPSVLDSPALSSYDFFATRQMIGGKQGVYRPEPVYLCSPAFRQMVLEERLLGFAFEVAHVV